MDLPRLAAMGRYWQQFPPLHVMAAGRWGYEAPKPKTEADLGELLNLFEGGQL